MRVSVLCLALFLSLVVVARWLTLTWRVRSATVGKVHPTVLPYGTITDTTTPPLLQHNNNNNKDKSSSNSNNNNNNNGSKESAGRPMPGTSPTVGQTDRPHDGRFACLEETRYSVRATFGTTLTQCSTDTTHFIDCNEENSEQNNEQNNNEQNKHESKTSNESTTQKNGTTTGRVDGVKTAAATATMTSTESTEQEVSSFFWSATGTWFFRWFFPLSKTTRSFIWLLVWICFLGNFSPMSSSSSSSSRRPLPTHSLCNQQSNIYAPWADLESRHVQSDRNVGVTTAVANSSNNSCHLNTSSSTRHIQRRKRRTASLQPQSRLQQRHKQHTVHTHGIQTICPAATLPQNKGWCWSQHPGGLVWRKGSLTTEAALCMAGVGVVFIGKDALHPYRLGVTVHRQHVACLVTTDVLPPAYLRYPLVTIQEGDEQNDKGLRLRQTTIRER